VAAVTTAEPPGSGIAVRLYLVGGEPVAFRAANEEHRYLRRFYPEADAGQPASVLVSADRAGGPGGCAIVDDGCRAVSVPYPGRSPADALRLVARSRWLGRLSVGQLVLHGVALGIAGTIVLVVGRAHSGKTTLLLDALIAHGAKALAYDSLLVDLDRGTGRHVPSIMNVRYLTLASVGGAPALLADHELDLDGTAVAERYYAPGAFCVPSSFAIPAERAVLVLSRGFATDARARLARISPADAAAGVSDVLEAWGGWTDIARVARLLRVAGPSARELSLRLAHRLATGGGYAFSHHGCPAALLSVATGERATPCRHRWDTRWTPSLAQSPRDGMSRDPVTPRVAT
jgi:hypothetical protein